jgi:uncharacterized Zn finger protein (UPF0148 family)
MPSFVLERLTLLSLREKRGRRFSFHPKTTIVKGDNDTGKSSLLKSVYRCFGAEPARTHDKWKDARVLSVLTYSLDGKTFHALQNQGQYSFFDAARNHIQSFDSVTNGVAPYFARAFGFGLKLPTRKNDLIVPPPAYLLLPFYIDQDAGWKNSWASFAKLDQFANWKKDLAEYHAGIRPNEYYRAKGTLEVLGEKLKPLSDRRSTLGTILLGLEERLKGTSFDIDIEAYQQDVKELLIIGEKIKRREEKLRDELVRHYSAKSVTEAQIVIANDTINDLLEDIDYIAAHEMEDHVDCPMCGAVYENTFEERLAVAQDEDRCHELLSQLREDLSSTTKQIEETNRRFIEAKAEFARVNEILNTNRGKLELRDLIESEGRREAHRVIRADIEDVERKIADIDKEIIGVKAEMERYDDAERKKAINKRYRELMRSFLFDVEVHTLKYEKLYVYSNISETGSDLPRALLAYYYSNLHLMQDHSTAAFCPVIIDSPNQQDQDLVNLKKMLHFIRDQRPKDSQIVLGLVDDCGVGFDGEVIELIDKYHLLQTRNYADIADDVRDLLNKARAAEE